MTVEFIQNDDSKTTEVSSALFVDLDGSLLATDIFLEGLLLAVKKKPAWLLGKLFLMFSNRAVFKREVSTKVTPNISLLPYNEEIISYIHDVRNNGVRIILATASDQYWAESIALKLELFDDVLSSDGQTNLKGTKKLEAIKLYCAEHGINHFGYIGNSVSDIPIWKEADDRIVVTHSKSFIRYMHKHSCAPKQIVEDRVNRLQGIASVIRSKQWVKNLLLFLPLILSHLLIDTEKLASVLMAFFSFSLCASSIYIVNDLLDIESDRRHPTKNKRPFASGRLPVIYGPPLVLILAGLGVGLAVLFLPVMFLFFLSVYLVATTLYSFWLKRKLMIDVVLLSGLYTIRILAGGAAAGVPVSEWLICFSMFLFTSLAFAKRYSELKNIGNSSNGKKANGRGYQVSDSSIVEMMGQTCGLLSVLVLALYIQSDKVKLLYHHTRTLWLLCPILLYWVGRLWLLAHRGTLTEDPVAFTATDRKSWVIVILTGFVLYFST